MFIKKSFVPETDVRAVIVDRSAPGEVMEKLNSLNISTVLSAKTDNIITGVCTHPDMQIFHLENNIFICEPSVYDYYNKELSKFGMQVFKGDTASGSNYPNDIAYNVSRVGNLLFGRADKIDKKILDSAAMLGYRIINAKQGYTKCNTCIIGENAVITSDSGLGRLFMENNIDVLEITGGNINLEGAGYGFIGGCCGLISKNKLAVCGDIANHPDCDKIMTFLSSHEVDIINLFDGPLTDIGSIIPILQS